RSQGSREDVVVVLKDGADLVLMALDHANQQRLQRVLAEVPLAHSEAEALIVEITADPRERVRRPATRFERSCEREATFLDRLVWKARSRKRLRNGRRLEELAPGACANDSINDEVVGPLKRLHGGFGPAPERSVARPTVKPLGCKLRLDLCHFRPARAPFVD